MCEYLSTESEISELSEVGEDFHEMMNRNNFLLNELELMKKKFNDKEFEMGNNINILKFENENLKQTIKSYDELMDYYKNVMGDKNNLNVQRKSTSGDLLKSNLELIQKITDLENKNFLSEQNEHNLKREIFTLNSLTNQYKFEIEKMNNERFNTEENIVDLSTTKKSSRRVSENFGHVIDENDIKDLLQEIDDLKKEKADVSERALNMLTEKELEILELRSFLEELKQGHEKEISDLKHKIQFSSESRSISSELDYDIQDPKDLIEKLHRLEEDYSLLKKEMDENENSWLHEKEKLNNYTLSLENSNKTITNDLETETAKLRNEIHTLELEKATLEKELIKDKSSIENEIEHYTHVVKVLEEQNDKFENNSRHEINILKAELKEIDLTNASLREQIFSSEKQIADLKNEHLKKIESIQEKWKADITNKENETVKIKSKIETLEKEKDSLRKECENNRKKNDKTKQEYKDLLDQLRKLKEMNEEEKRKWEDKIANLESSHESERIFLKNQIKELKSSLDENGFSDNFFREKKVSVTSNTSSTSNANINLMDYNSEENPSLLKNKIHILEAEVQKLNSLIKLKDNKSVNVFRLNGEVEILKKEKTKLKNEMIEMKEMYEIQIRDLMQKVSLSKPENNSARKSSFKPGNFCSKQLLENMELEEKIEQCKKENKFLSDQIEILKKEIENTKVIKDNYIKKLKEDLEETERITGIVKISLAQIAFEKDSDIIKYRKLCKKLKMKLTNMSLIVGGGAPGNVRPDINVSNYHTNTSSSTNPQKKTSFFDKFFNK